MVKTKLSVLNVVVSEFGRMAYAIHVLEKCSDICAETVGIGFHARKALHPHKILFFCLNLFLKESPWVLCEKNFALGTTVDSTGIFLLCCNHVLGIRPEHGKV